MIVGVNHVQITVPASALDDARRFYIDLLGFKPIPRPSNFQSAGLWLRAGDFELHIGLEDGVERARTRAHIAYEVDDIRACREIAAVNAMPIKEQPPIEGFERFHSRDPFGNTIEFIQRVPSAITDSQHIDRKAAGV